MILWKLFYAFFTIGLFSIGGGYAIIPMIRDQVVMQNHWLSVQEFRDIITISQMTPGHLRSIPQPLLVCASLVFSVLLRQPLDVFLWEFSYPAFCIISFNALHHLEYL